MLPARVAYLRRKELCDTVPLIYSPHMAEARFQAADMICTIALSLSLGTAAAWTAIRLFDAFYAKVRNRTWEAHWKFISVVSVDLASCVASHENNFCETPPSNDPLAWLRDAHGFATDEMPSQFSFRFVRAFEHARTVFLQTLDFAIALPTPEEYLSECCHWLDPGNAARGSPLRSQEERRAAEATAYVYMAIAHSPDSTRFTAYEIVSFASYIATSPARSAPQSESARLETPALTKMWSGVSWTRANEISRVFLGILSRLQNLDRPRTLSIWYPIEHSRWISHTHM